MKKLSLLLIVLFVLVGCVGCTSTSKKATVTQKTSASKDPRNNSIIPGLTLKGILKTFEPLGLTLEAFGSPEPGKDSSILWHGRKVIKIDSGELPISFTATGYSENEINSFHIIINESSSTHNAQNFEAEVLEILLLASKIPIEGVNNNKVEEWIKEDALKHAEKMNFFIDNNTAYNLNNEGPGLAKIFTILRYEQK